MSIKKSLHWVLKSTKNCQLWVSFPRLSQYPYLGLEGPYQWVHRPGQKVVGGSRL